MEYWHEIVSKYDDIKSLYRMTKNTGDYSQSSVIILLIYLTFGSDYRYNIMKFFKEPYRPIDPNIIIPYSRNLNTPKIYILLKRMEEDELVTVTEKEGSINPQKFYSINPQIVQSPIKGGGYIKGDGSTFEIPLEMIERFLPWRDLEWEEHKDLSGRDRFFSHVVYPNTIDFFFFIEILGLMAKHQNWDIESNRGRLVEPCPFEKLLKEYYDEIDDYDYNMGKRPRDYFNPFRKKT